MSASASAVVVRYGEVFLKRGRRQKFLDLLCGNLERTLYKTDPKLKLSRPYGRFLAIPHLPGTRIEDPDAVTAALAGVFGAVWAGPCEIVSEPTMETLTAAAADYARQHHRRAQRTFKIDTTRADKRFPGTSVDVSRALGGAVQGAIPELKVDLHAPDLVINVEIRDGYALIYGAGRDGVGGLPVGSNGKALLMLSGGIDSPVAGWLTQKRGVAVDAVTFLSPPYTGAKTEEKVVALARMVARSQRRMRLWVVPFTAVQERCRDLAPPAELVLLYRRAMVRIADALAIREGHQALVTGESIGQVASQTLPNLHCIELAATRPVLRPLLTYDKLETIGLAQRIGTFETSIQPHDDCCSLFVPRHPELKGDPVHLTKIEVRVDSGEIERQALDAARCIELT